MLEKCNLPSVQGLIPAFKHPEETTGAASGGGSVATRSSGA